MLVGAIAVWGLTSCDDDRDHNPVLDSRTAPTTFPLNTPALASSVVDLATSDNLTFSWSQPAYGFPAAVEYQMQISADNVWTTSVADSLADETQSTPATYATVGSPTGTVTTNVTATEVATALEQIKHWTSDAVPATTTVYARCMATYADKTIYSNVVSFTVVPYYVELSDAAPEIWYLIGGCIGDGSWGSDIGTNVIPLTPLAGEEYDKTTGRGKIGWTGYLTSAGFKIRGSLTDNWARQIGQGDAYGDFAVNNGGSGNITVPEDGIYVVTLDTKQYAADEAADNATTTALTITKYDETPTVYESIRIAGDFNGWSTDQPMNAVHTYAGAVNHDWYFDLDATGGDTTAKFLYDPGTWQPNWGSDTFPYGWGVNNGSNIPVTAGNYRVLFNDITGTYYFVEK